MALTRAKRLPTPAEKADVKRWRSILVRLGAVGVVLAIGFQIWASKIDSTTTKDETTAKKTVTTMTGVGPPATLITTFLGGGVLLMLAGAFYGRITKISWNGVVIELGSDQAADVTKKAVAAAHTLTRLSTDPKTQGETMDRLVETSMEFAIAGNTLLAHGYPVSVIPSMLGVADVYPPGRTLDGDGSLSPEQWTEFINNVAVKAAINRLDLG